MLLKLMTLLELMGQVLGLGRLCPGRPHINHPRQLFPTGEMQARGTKGPVPTLRYQSHFKFIFTRHVPTLRFQRHFKFIYKGPVPTLRYQRHFKFMWCQRSGTSSKRYIKSKWRDIWIRDVFWSQHRVSQHLGCWGQNRSPYAQGCDLS